MSYVFRAIGTVGVLLQILLLYFLFQGYVRKYSFLFVYCLAQLVIAIVETLVFQAGRSSALYARVYWTDELVMDLLLFVMVIDLTYRALEGNPARASALKFLSGVVAAVLVLPFLIFRRPFTARWFNETSQLLTFGGAIMNLALWTALIGSKRRDPQLLTVSAGLGIAVAGAAISYGVRQWVGHWTPHGAPMWLIDTVIPVTNIASVAVWCSAFRPAPEPRTAPQTAVPEH